MKFILIIVSLILASCSQTNVDQFILENGTPDEIEYGNTYTMHYNESSSFYINENGEIAHEFCSLKIKVENNIVINHDNKTTSCKTFIANNPDGQKEIFNITKRRKIGTHKKKDLIERLNLLKQEQEQQNSKKQKS
jgi:hypothetical protein